MIPATSKQLIELANYYSGKEVSIAELMIVPGSGMELGGLVYCALRFDTVLPYFMPVQVDCEESRLRISSVAELEKYECCKVTADGRFHNNHNYSHPIDLVVEASRKYQEAFQALHAGFPEALWGAAVDEVMSDRRIRKPEIQNPFFEGCLTLMPGQRSIYSLPRAPRPKRRRTRWKKPIVF